MRLTFTTLATIFILHSFFNSKPGIVLASGTTSSQDQPGQVRLNSNGEAIYLGTNVNQGGSRLATTSATNSANRQTPRYSKTLGETIVKPLGFAQDIGQYINSVLSLVMALGVLLVFFYFVLAGFQWITSGGNKGKTEEARNKIINAFVGIIILASTFALATFIAYILGFESINDALMNIRRINQG